MGERVKRGGNASVASDVACAGDLDETRFYGWVPLIAQLLGVRN